MEQMAFVAINEGKCPNESSWVPSDFDPIPNTMAEICIRGQCVVRVSLFDRGDGTEAQLDIFKGGEPCL